jgi:hypothetical protein
MITHAWTWRKGSAFSMVAVWNGRVRGRPQSIDQDIARMTQHIGLEPKKVEKDKK